MKASRGIRWIVLMLIALFVAPLVVSAAPQGDLTAKTGYSSQTLSGVVVTANGTLKGTVWNTVGQAIAGATITATTGSTTYLATTNTSGLYSRSLPGGSYTVTVSKTGCTPQTKMATVSSGATTTLNFSLSCSPSGTGILTGNVWDGWTGQPIVGATVRAIGPTYLVATTDANGRYSMILSGGSYTVTASKTGYYSRTEYGVVVSNGATTGMDFFLDDTSNPCPTC